MKMRLIAIENYTLVNPSGFEKRFTEIILRLTKYFDITIIVPQNTVKYLNKKNMRSLKLIITKAYDFQDKEFVGYVLFVWFLRILRTIWFMPKFTADLILYSGSSTIVNVIPAIVGKMLNKNPIYVQVMHDIEVDGRVDKNNRIYGLFYRLFRSIDIFFIKTFADVIITVSNQVKKELEKYGFRRNIVIVGCGVDKDNINKTYNSTLVKRGYDGVFVGRLAISKGIFDLIKIWEIVMKIKPDARLAIIGSHFDIKQGELFSRIKERNLSNIDILSYLPEHEIIEILKNSKIFVFPSYTEGFGMVVAEAMMCRLPVVSYDLPVFKDLFPEGIIMENLGDCDGFARSVLTLLNDDDMRIRLSSEAFNTANKLKTWNEVAKEELEIIKSYVSRVEKNFSLDSLQ